MMEELHTDSIDGGHEASYRTRSRARERAYSNSIFNIAASILISSSNVITAVTIVPITAYIFFPV
jgi:hypothetical protein